MTIKAIHLTGLLLALCCISLTDTPTGQSPGPLPPVPKPNAALTSKLSILAVAYGGIVPESSGIRRSMGLRPLSDLPLMPGETEELNTILSLAAAASAGVPPGQEAGALKRAI